MSKSNKIDRLNLHSGIVPYNKFDSLEKINEEVFENNLSFGDSLLGRLVNSFVRKAKIGYNQTKIKNLLEAFKRELDGMIASAVSRDTKSELNKLLIKSLFDEIKKTCTDNVDDEKKLDSLVGAHEDLWDPAKQDGGNWKNIINSGLLFEIYNQIDNEMDDADLRKTGIKKDELLDNISVFIDNLRKMTVESTASNTQSSSSSFSANFGNVVNSLSRIVASYEFSFDVDSINEDELLRFEDFILEKTDPEKLKANVAKREEDLKKMSKNDPNREAMENELSVAKSKLPKSDNVTGQKSLPSGPSGPETGLVATGKKETGVTNTSGTQSGQPIKAKSTDVAGATTRERILKLINLAKKCKDKNFDSPKSVISDKIGLAFIKQASSLTPEDMSFLFAKSRGIKVEVDGDDLFLQQALDTVISEPDFDPIQKQFKTTGIRSKDSNKQIFFSKLYTKEMKIKDFSDKLELCKKVLKKDSSNDVAKKKKLELETYLKKLGVKIASTEVKKPSKVKESFNFNSDILTYKLYEEAPGTQSGGTQSGGGQPADPKPTVEGEYEEFFRDAPELLTGGMTQGDFDKLEKMLQGSTNEEMLLDLSKNPDPIIAIIRVFSRAHDLYFTDYIPSGRTGGKVSNKTMREYTPLGKDGGGTPDEPKGPFAIKSILNKWTDGVMEILEDQKYRKILSNIKFVNAGAEDTFNKESFVLKLSDFRLILEGDDKDSDPTGEVKKSQGQILFDFINSMLDKETIADFDSQKRKLLRKYFGGSVEGKLPSDGSRRNLPSRPISNEDKDAKTLVWKKCEESKFKSGSFYAIPIKKQNDHEFIFLQTIREEDGKMLIKFTFNRPLIVNKYKEVNYPSYTIPLDWKIDSGDRKPVYYALVPLTLPGSGRKLKIVYANVTDGTSAVWGGNVHFAEFDVEWGDKGVLKNLCTSKLVRIDEAKSEKAIDRVDFEKRVSGEKNNHIDSLKLESGSKKVLDSLKTEATTKQL